MSWDIGHQNEKGNKIFNSEELSEVFGEGLGDKVTPIFCIIHKTKKTIKPLRGTPEVLEEDFFKHLVVSKSDNRIYYYNSEGLNGWKGLKLLHFIQLSAYFEEEEKKKGFFYNPEETRSFSKGEIFWSASPENKDESLPKDLNFPETSGDMIVAKLLLPDHCRVGYSKNNPGYVFYYNQEKKVMSHGKNILSLYEDKTIPDPEAVSVYHFGHRYAKVKETARDRYTFHTACLVQFSDNTCSIYELAWRHGIGAYRGKSNWVDDQPSMYAAIPNDMILPWQSKQSEIRVTDLPAIVQDKSSFETFLAKYTGKTLRFVAPKFKEESLVNISPRKKSDLFRYVLNRAEVNGVYSEPIFKSGKGELMLSVGKAMFKGIGAFSKECGYNCQTFSAAFYAFLSGKNAKKDFAGLSPMTLSLAMPSERAKWFVENDNGEKKIVSTYDDSL
eukprot:snap_masked-scaffold_40-processed-gene-2.15-mRNA-1 protein AED:1.00 eAED:1.00 QI:0/-1/0/0/-1/1/1/0/442